MLRKKNWLVILVSPNTLTWLSAAIASPQVIQIPTTVIDNLEVLNRDALYTIIADWTKAQTYSSSEVIWLLSPGVYFEQIFPDSEKDRWDSASVQFLDSVPFEHVVSRVYTPVEGRQVIATNREFVMALIQAYSMHGYSTRAVVPLKFVSSQLELTKKLYHSVINHAIELTRDTLVTLDSSDTPISSSLMAPSTPKSSLPLLLTVFAILLAILGIVVYLNQ